MGDFSSFQIGSEQYESNIVGQNDTAEDLSAMTRSTLAHQSGVTRVSIGLDGEFEEAQQHRGLHPDRIDAGQLRDDSGAGILSSAHDGTGLPVSRITSNTLFDFGGMEIDARTAVTLGYLRREGDSFVETEKGRDVKGSLQTQGSDPMPDQQQPQRVPVILDSEGQEIMDKLNSTVGSEGIQAAVAKYLSEDGMSRQDVSNLARSVGVSDDEAAKMVQLAYGHHYVSALSYLQVFHKIENPQEVFDWAAKSVDKKDLSYVFQRMVGAGDFDGVDSLVKLYHENTMPSWDDLADQGWRPVGRQGNEYLIQHSKWGKMTATAAKRAGLIR